MTKNKTISFPTPLSHFRVVGGWSMSWLLRHKVETHAGENPSIAGPSAGSGMLTHTETMQTHLLESQAPLWDVGGDQRT